MKNLIASAVLAGFILFSANTFANDGEHQYAFEQNDVVEITNGPNTGLVVTVIKIYELDGETEDDSVVSYYVYTVTEEGHEFHGLFREDDLEPTE